MSNGAERLLETLVAGGVEICFANPGTSEMQLVSAIGGNDRMRPVLCLFEGVAAGAADGYARMCDKPAATLLHLGSGFSNSMANQHNAKRAHVPLVNIVGDHATYHLKYDAPLTSDVPAHAAICSGWVGVSQSAAELAAAGARAVQAARRGWGRIATLVVPANHAWEEAASAAPALPAEPLAPVPEASVEAVASALGNGKTTAFLLGGRALREDCLAVAGRIAAACGARILCETFPARLQRGAGRVAVERLPYFADQVAPVLAGLQQLILVGAAPPVSFFAYPGKEGWLTPPGCELLTLAEVDQDVAAALETLLAAAPSERAPDTAQLQDKPAAPSGALTPLALAQSLASLMPDNAIVVDEAVTCGLAMFPATLGAPPHDWLTLTGGAIGEGLPLALGAAIACPERKVVALEADGSAMYTIQALWSMAREGTDVTVVIMNNRSYAILNIELARVGAGAPTAKTLSMFDLSGPDLDFVAIARGMGVRATRAGDAGAFHRQFAEAMATPGPCLIDATVVQSSD